MERGTIRPKARPIVKRGRTNLWDEEEAEGLQSIPEHDELVFNSDPQEWVKQLLVSIDSNDAEKREETAYSIVGLQLEQSRTVLISS